MDNNTPLPLVTAAEISDLTGVDPVRVAWWARRGLVPSCSHKGRRLYHLDAVVAAIAENTTSTTP